MTPDLPHVFQGREERQEANLMRAVEATLPDGSTAGSLNRLDDSEGLWVPNTPSLSCAASSTAQKPKRAELLRLLA